MNDRLTIKKDLLGHFETTFHAADAMDGKPWKGLVFIDTIGGLPWKWLERMVEHPDGGIAQVISAFQSFWFHDLVWERADEILIPKGDAPILVAYGTVASERLYRAWRDRKIGGVWLDQWDVS